MPPSAICSVPGNSPCISCASEHYCNLFSESTAKCVALWQEPRFKVWSSHLLQLYPLKLQHLHVDLELYCFFFACLVCMRLYWYWQPIYRNIHWTGSGRKIFIQSEMNLYVLQVFVAHVRLLLVLFSVRVYRLM